jgi:predicted dehydrogenase
MKNLRLAIIGGGHLGKIHARLAAALPDTQIVAVVETNPVAARTIASELGLTVSANLAEVEREIDAAIIATPTMTHFQIASRLLKRGIHLLVEKPFTATAPQADQLVDLAAAKNLIVQVGHVERFNPSFEQAVALMPHARHVEARRCSGYTFRSSDIGVVHDLMIHDIDLVCSLTESALVEVRATGVAVFGPHEDIAEARLQFADGTVACLKASRCSFDPARRFAWYSEDGYIDVDLSAGKIRVASIPSTFCRKSHRDVSALDTPDRNRIRDNLFSEVFPLQEIVVAPANAIQQEQQEFVHSIRTGKAPRCDGRAARRAIAIAQDIVDCISRHKWCDGENVRIGAQTESACVPRVINPLVRYGRAA